MARAVADIEREIRALGPQEKEQLLRALLEELSGPPDPDVECAWLEEAQRRSSEFDRGLVATSPSEDVFRRAREDLRRR